jgi:hypothetical protein
VIPATAAPPFAVGDRVTFTRGPDLPAMPHGTVETTGGARLLVRWTYWSPTSKRHYEIRRHCRPDQLVREGEG